MPPPAAGRSQTEVGAPFQAQPPPAMVRSRSLRSATDRAADEEDVALAGGDTAGGDLDGADPGALLAQEGARRAGDLVDDRDVAGDQVRELREEERRPQVVRKALVEEFERRAVAPGCRRGSPRRPPGRARRRSPRRRCGCGRECRRCRRCRRRRARGPPNRCRPAASSPSAAGRRGVGICLSKSSGTDRMDRVGLRSRRDRPPAAAARPRPSPASGRRALRRGSRRGRCR